MTLNTPIFAVIDPATNEVLGNGECPALYSREPSKVELAYVRTYCGCPAAVVVKCRIVREEE